MFGQHNFTEKIKTLIVFKGFKMRVYLGLY